MPNRYSIVAMKPLGTEEIVAKLTPGAVVTLVRQPNNKFDRNAIMVWVDGKHVGYIPKATNEQLAGFIDMTGHKWDGPLDVTGSAGLAQDAVTPRIVGAKSIVGKFVRSPNSNYPQVEV